jgi:predicted SnoaL-like aldol condensation-catalyzing enzyme
MNNKDPKLTALQFNECINNRDLAGLTLLMTDDHAFIDREGVVSQPKAAMVQGWKRFFEMFPEYKNTFNRIESKDNLVTILGYAYWSESRPYDPAIWTATIVDDLVQVWRIYSDTESNRKKFNLL